MSLGLGPSALVEFSCGKRAVTLTTKATKGTQLLFLVSGGGQSVPELI